MNNLKKEAVKKIENKSIIQLPKWFPACNCFCSVVNYVEDNQLMKGIEVQWDMYGVTSSSTAGYILRIISENIANMEYDDFVMKSETFNDVSLTDDKGEEVLYSCSQIKGIYMNAITVCKWSENLQEKFDSIKEMVEKEWTTYTILNIKT